MIKKSLAVLSVAVAFFAYGQDVSVIRNAVDVYSDTQFSGTSRYNSMAGSMGALGGDISSMAINPAGVGVAIASDLGVTLNINSSENKSALHGNSYKYKINDTDLNHVGGIAVFPLRNTSAWKFVNVGFSYNRKSAEDYIETPGNQNITYDLPNDDQLLFSGHAYDRVGNASKMSIAVGGNYDNRIYVGGAINLHTASISQYDSAAMTYASDNYSEIFNKQYTPFQEDGSGFSASVGVIGKINNALRLGASIETPTWWTIDRAYQYYGYNSDEDGIYSEKRNLATPFKTTISAALVPNKDLSVNLDYSLGLSKPNFGKMDSAAQTEMDNFMDNNYKNMSEIRIGAEYRIMDLRLRAGYAYASSPFDQMTLNTISSSGQLIDQSFDNLYVGKRNTVGAGIGYDFKSFYIDAAYNHITSEINSPFLSGSASAGSEYYSDSAFFSDPSPLVSQVDNKRNNFSITLGWKF